MKKLIAALLVAAMALGCVAALAESLPDFFRFPDPGVFAGTDAKLFQMNYGYKGIAYDAYEYAQPGDVQAFLADWQQALSDNGFMTAEGDEQGNAAVFFSNGTLDFLNYSDSQGFLLYNYQGRMLLMVPSAYEFTPGAEPVAEQPAEASAEQPAEQPAEEQPAEQPAEEPAVEQPAAEQPAEGQPAEAPAEPEPEPTPTPVPDLSSDMVEEFDPSEDQVPIEYTLDQDFLAQPDWEEQLAAQLAAEEAAAAEPTPTPEPYPELKKGDKGDDVKKLQEALITLGFLKDKADGMFGGKTEKAIKKAQKKYKMEQTGIADDAFQRKLYKKAKKKAAASSN